MKEGNSVIGEINEQIKGKIKQWRDKVDKTMYVREARVTKKRTDLGEKAQERRNKEKKEKI